MTDFALIQAVIITAVVGFSTWQAFRKLMPKTSKRLLGRLSATLEQPQRSALAHRLARWLQPKEAKAGGCGSGDGCGSCGGCAPPTVKTPSAPVEPQPLHFRPRPHH